VYTFECVFVLVCVCACVCVCVCVCAVSAFRFQACIVFAHGVAYNWVHLSCLMNAPNLFSSNASV